MHVIYFVNHLIFSKKSYLLKIYHTNQNKLYFISKQCNKSVEIISSDGVKFTLTTEVAYRSEKIKETCRHQGLNETVTLSDVNGIMLEKLVSWMEQYKNGSPFDVSKEGDESDKFNAWDLEYLKIERETLFALARAAHSMEVRGLIDFCVQAIANLLDGKTSAQISAVFGLPRLNPKVQRRRPAM